MSTYMLYISMSEEFFPHSFPLGSDKMTRGRSSFSMTRTFRDDIVWTLNQNSGKKTQKILQFNSLTKALIVVMFAFPVMGAYTKKTWCKLQPSLKLMWWQKVENFHFRFGWSLLKKKLSFAPSLISPLLFLTQTL